MRILKVNDNTVRIFISFAELADRNISLADFFQKSARTEQFFWELISKAREEVDFSLDQPFWIQATLISEEEFAITVIKQEEYGDKEINHLLGPADGEEKRGRSRQSLALGQSKFAVNQEWIYAFEEIEDIINALDVLPELQVASVLYEFEAEYYLVISPFKGARKKKTAEAVLDEFGEAVLSSEAYLREHATCVIEEQALEKLALMKR